jgi:hypothetical protein
VAVVCGLAAVLGALLLLTTNRTTKIADNVIVEGLTRIDADNSATILHNPTKSGNVVTSYRIDRPNYSAAIQYSNDGGKTWTRTQLPLPNGTQICSATIAANPCPFAPDMAFDRHGKLYVTYTNLIGNGNGPQFLWLATSTDGGKTLSPPVKVAGGVGEIFQARLAVARDGTIYITWLQGGETGNLSLLGTNPIVAVHSTDGGQTFSQPVVISDSGRDRVGAAMPAVDDKGVVTVLYEDFKGDRRDFENLEGPVFEDPFALVVTRSTDGGKTWTAGDEFESGVIPTRRFLVYLPESPSLAVSHDGTIYATWMDGRDGDEDVFLKKSSDGAKTWSAPIRVNNNPKGDGTNQYLPRVSIGGGGRVNVLFLDRRRDPRNIMTDAELATSTDGGKTFTNRRISSQSFDGTIGPMVSELTGADFGTHLGLDSWGNHVLAAWTDTREGSQADGQQDIATTHVTFPATVPFLGQPVVIIVLFVIGAVALAMALREGRRPEPTVVKETAKA